MPDHSAEADQDPWSEPGTTTPLRPDGQTAWPIGSRNPFEVLAAAAEQEYRQGRTISLARLLEELDPGTA